MNGTFKGKDIVQNVHAKLYRRHKKKEKNELISSFAVFFENVDVKLKCLKFILNCVVWLNTLA